MKKKANKQENRYLSLCLMQLLHRLHLFNWQEDIKSLRRKSRGVSVFPCCDQVVMEVKAVFTVLLFSDLCAEIKTVSCVLAFIHNYVFKMTLVCDQTGEHSFPKNISTLRRKPDIQFKGVF